VLFSGSGAYMEAVLKSKAWIYINKYGQEEGMARFCQFYKEVKHAAVSVCIIRVLFPRSLFKLCGLLQVLEFASAWSYASLSASCFQIRCGMICDVMFQHTSCTGEEFKDVNRCRTCTWCAAPVEFVHRASPNRTKLAVAGMQHTACDSACKLGVDAEIALRCSVHTESMPCWSLNAERTVLSLFKPAGQEIEVIDWPKPN
jgi:hypothetical protein